MGLVFLIGAAALTALILANRLPASIRLGEWLRKYGGVAVVPLAIVTVLLGSDFLFRTPGPGFFLLILGALALLIVAWLREFSFLMRLGDDAFPGRFDKPIWAALLILLPPVGVLTFWSYRKAHWPEAKAQAKATPSHASWADLS
jgi:hypothetical protein